MAATERNFSADSVLRDLDTGAPPGLESWGCPRASASHWLWGCRCAVPLSAGRSWCPGIPATPPGSPPPRAGTFDRCDRHVIQSGPALVSSHLSLRRLQRVAPIDPVIPRVEPELRFLLGLLTQLLSQKREFSRQRDLALTSQTRFLPLPFLRSGDLFQAVFSSSYRNSLAVRPLRSTVVTRLLAVGSEEARLRASHRPPLKLHVRFSRMQLSRRLKRSWRPEKELIAPS